MKLTGMLKKQVEKAETREAAKETIAKAGMLLTDDELDQVSGGFIGGDQDYYHSRSEKYFCNDCKREFFSTAGDGKVRCSWCHHRNVYKVS